MGGFNFVEKDNSASHVGSRIFTKFIFLVTKIQRHDSFIWLLHVRERRGRAVNPAAHPIRSRGPYFGNGASEFRLKMHSVRRLRRIANGFSSAFIPLRCRMLRTGLLSAVWHSFMRCAARRLLFKAKISSRPSAPETQHVAAYNARAVITYILSSREFSWWLRCEIPTLEIKNFKSSKAHFLIYAGSQRFFFPFHHTALKRVNICARFFFITLRRIFSLHCGISHILSFRRE